MDVPLGKAQVGRFSDGEIRVEIDENVQIRVAKAAVQGRVGAPAADTSEKPAAE